MSGAGTTSTVPLVLDALLGNVGPVVPCLFSEVWPGSEAQDEMLFLGLTEWDGYEIASIKVGRKHRQENYRIPFELWNVGPEDTTPDDPSSARDRAFEILASIEDAVAVDVTAGAGFNPLQWISLRPGDAGPHEFDNGWAYIIRGHFVVAARLI